MPSAPKLIAMASSPRNGFWTVLFYYTDENGRQDHNLPSQSIPAMSYDHARQIADAFNTPANPPVSRPSPSAPVQRKEPAPMPDIRISASLYEYDEGSDDPRAIEGGGGSRETLVTTIRGTERRIAAYVTAFYNRYGDRLIVRRHR